MDMSNPRTICEPIIHEIMAQGEAKGHGRDAWHGEPVTMHLMKGSRHGLTAIGMIDHPEFVKDKESALQHVDQAIARLAFARAILTDQGDKDENQLEIDFTQNQSAESEGALAGNGKPDLTREYFRCNFCGHALVHHFHECPGIQDVAD